jgi:hypothetical protein
MVSDQAPATFERASGQVNHHENVVGNIVLRVKTLWAGGQESKARVITRVSQHEDNPVIDPSALLQSLSNQQGTDAFALVFGKNRHWSKAHCYKRGVLRFDGDGTEEDVADDDSFKLGDQ